MTDNILSKLLELLDKMIEKTNSEETISKIMDLLNKAIEDKHSDATAMIPAEVPLLLTTSVLDDNERIAPLQAYIMRIKDYATTEYQPKFQALVKYLTDDQKIQSWLFATSKAGYKCFNKLRTFKLARLMKQQHVLQYEKDTQLNKILELTDDDTSYRRNLNSEHSEDKEMLAYIADMIVCFQEVECNLQVENK